MTPVPISEAREVPTPEDVRRVVLAVLSGQASGHPKVKSRTVQLPITPGDLDRAYVENDGTTPSIQAGTIAARPAATAVSDGALYLANDEGKVYRGEADAWVLWATRASLIGAADLGFDPATQAELDSVQTTLQANLDVVDAENDTHRALDRNSAHGGAALSIGNGGTGATTVAAALAALGIARGATTATTSPSGEMTLATGLGSVGGIAGIVSTAGNTITFISKSGGNVTVTVNDGAGNSVNNASRTVHWVAVA